MIDKLSQDCPNCDNSGSITVTVTGIGHGCCGDVLPNGECCGNAIPVAVAEQGQEQCQFCYEEPYSVFNLTNQALKETP